MWTLIIITLIADAQYGPGGQPGPGGAAVNSQIGTVNFSSEPLCDKARKALVDEAKKETAPAPDGSIGFGVGNTKYKIITICANNSLPASK